MKYYLLLGLLIISSCKEEKTDWINRSLHKGLFELNYSQKFETYATEEQPENIKRTIQILEYSKYGDSILVKFRNLLIKTDKEKVGTLDNFELNKILIEELGNETMEIIKWKYDS